MTGTDLTGKTAIVTGGSRGIGKAISLALAQSGVNVVIAARTEKENPAFPGTIYQTQKEIEGLGGNAIAIRSDVTDSEQICKMVELTLKTFGGINILINNAGALDDMTFLQTDLVHFEKIWRVNVPGPFLCTRAVLPHMIENKRGNIINISSGLAQSTRADHNVYSASKAALDHMMLKLSGEIAEYNIAVNQIYPGVVGSEGMIAQMQGDPLLDTLPPPSIVGPPVLWLAAQDASFSGKICSVATFKKEWP